MARRRSRLNAALRRGVSVGIVLASVAWVLTIFDRLPAAPLFNWWWLGGAFVLFAILDMLLAWWSCRPGDLPLAAGIDERLGLEDRLATALHCSDRVDPVSQAALADGIAVASDPRTGEHLRRTWRVTVPETWWVIPVLVLAAFLTGFMGQADVLAGQDETRPQSVDGMAQPNDGMEQIMASIETQPELKEQLSDMLEELEAEQAMETGQTPEQQQLEALKRMTELQRRLEELTSGEVAQSMESLRTALEKLDVPEDGPASEMIKALSRGDFAKAAEAMESLQKELASGDMSESQRDELAEELESLTDQLEKLASDTSALKEALKQAGLDPQLANDGQALQQAMDQADQLSEQQKQQLMELVESQELTEGELRKLSEASKEMCKNCKDGSASGAGEKLGRQLSKMEQLKQMLQQAKQTSKQCRGQCQSLGQSLGNKPGSMPGPRSRGSEQQVAETETATESAQANTSAAGGPIAGEQQVDGMLRTGESVATFQDIISRSQEGFDDAFNDDRLPRKYHELIKHYFGDAGEVTEAVEFDAGQAQDTPEQGDSGDEPEPAPEPEPEPEPEPPAEESGSGE
ncbi:MAG: hypothetical protein P8K80_11520 [Phycisphaerales bacterium]|nr:hypothetical protein [Phycisphaerales bacterium]